MTTTTHNWIAPKTLEALENNSSWHISHATEDGACQRAGVQKGYVAGHFSLTGEGDPLAGWVGIGRTRGRALRRIRRYLKVAAVRFG